MVVLALLVIAGATVAGPKLRVAAPLLLVLIGIGVSFLPFVPAVEVEPEWILAGVLPPLLYSSSVSMPAMDFRREFRAIGGLSVVLVVASSVLLGLFFSWAIPDLSLAWGIALGAIVSPTDAVATSIVKRVGVAPRITAVLEGESLLNDATALVILRSAIAGAAASVSLWSVLGDFLLAVLIAVVIGFLVGKANLWVRSRVSDSTVNTVISLTVPFLASVPAEELEASGLVAAVVAGLVTGRGAARVLPPRHRLSDAQIWRAVEVILEGAIFLAMGLELFAIVEDVNEHHSGIGTALWVAAVALALTVLVRAAYVSPLITALHRRARRFERAKPRFVDLKEKLEGPEAADAFADNPRSRGPMAPARVERFHTRLTRGISDIDYFLAQPLGWREGTVVVWAGMRGAVTLAAAQTLPADTPNRPLLVFIAFLVAGGSLLLQGGTLPMVVRWVKPASVDQDAAVEERGQLLTLLADTAAEAGWSRATLQASDAEAPSMVGRKALALKVIDAQRQALLDARDNGLFSSGALSNALLNLDADQISIELRGSPDD